MIVTIIIFVLALAGAVCGVWGIGEKENICKYNYKGDKNQ